MNDIHQKIDRLFDPRFVTDFLGLQCDEGCIAAHVTCFYLAKADLADIRPFLDPAHLHADVGQIGCYRAKPVCAKGKWEANGEPVAEYKGIRFTYWVYREVLPVSSFREWLEQRKEVEDKKRPAIQALDAYEALADRQAISKEEMAPLVEAARSRYSVSWDIGMRFLSRLGAKHLAAREVMADLLRTGKAAEKVRVLGSLWDHLPKSFCIGLLRQGLKDRSKTVRQTAANVARCLILSELVDELCDAADVEQNPQTKWQMQHAAALIRDGYDLYKRPDGSEAFVVRISDGFPAKLLYPGEGWCTAEVIKRRGAKAVAEELRWQNAGATERPFRWAKE